MQTVRAALISEGFPAWPLYVALARGLFPAEGIDVALTVTGSSVRQLAALRAGEFDVGFQLPDHVVRAVEAGSDLFIVMAQAYAPDLALVAWPEIQSLADLRGKAVAVDGARTGYALLLRRLLRSAGLEEGDCAFAEFGGTQARFDAVVDRRAAASFLNPPFDRTLLAQGYTRLASTLAAFPRYPGPVVAARRSWAADHGDALVAFVRAYRGAFRWLAEPANAREAVAIAIARLGGDAVIAKRALAAFADRPPPDITDAGLAEVIDVVWEADRLPAPKGTPARYFDASVVRRAG